MEINLCEEIQTITGWRTHFHPWLAEDAASSHQDGLWIKARKTFRLEQSWLFYFTHFNHSISNAINKIVAAHSLQQDGLCLKIHTLKDSNTWWGGVVENAYSFKFKSNQGREKRHKLISDNR